MKDYRLEIKIKNNYLFTKMKEYGIENAAQLARAVGSNPSAVGYYLNLTNPPYTKKGELKELAKKLCDFFYCDIEDLFPAEHLENALDKNIVVTEKNKHELLPSRMLETDDPSVALIEQEVMQGIEYLISKILTDKEQKVIALSFGLRDEEPRSLEAIGELLGASGNRIGQIKKKALRKLGAPFNRDLFEPFMKPSHFAALTERNKEKLKRQAEENERLLQGLEILHQTIQELKLGKVNDY